MRIVRDRRLDNIDKYGRLLRYVFKGKQNINLLLVQKGAASVWYFQGDKGKYASCAPRRTPETLVGERGEPATPR